MLWQEELHWAAAMALRLLEEKALGTKSNISRASNVNHHHHSSSSSQSSGKAGIEQAVNTSPSSLTATAFNTSGHTAVTLNRQEDEASASSQEDETSASSQGDHRPTISAWQPWIDSLPERVITPLEVSHPSTLALLSDPAVADEVLRMQQCVRDCYEVCSVLFLARD